MQLPLNLHHHSLRLALACTAILAASVLLPVCAAANEAAARAQERAARAEERAARAQERQARRNARAEERAARRGARSSGREASGEGDEAGEESGDGASPPQPGAQPSTVPQRGCRVSIEASSERITAGETAIISGALECPSGTSLADQAIVVYQHQLGARAASALSLVGTATTGADGSYELTSPALDTNTVFQTRVGRLGAHTVVKVAPRVTLSAPSPLDAKATSAGGPHRAPTTATFTGTVSPAEAGARVALQVAYAASGERWRAVAFGRVAADGSYSITHTFRVTGEASVRTVVRTGKLMVPGISEPVAYEVPQPQNAQLTIETSADPISYGQPVTISGHAAGAPHQTITLLASTDGGAFRVVATSTTDESDDYTFTQEPLQRTCYRVTDATAHSTTLLQGVGFVLSTTATSATIAAGEQLTFSGTLAPASGGQAVYLERGSAAGTGFHVVGTGLVDAAAEYQIPYTFGRLGANVMRVNVPGNGRFGGTTSATFTITVTRLQ